MADDILRRKISQLTPTSEIYGDEMIPIVQSGKTWRVSPNILKIWLQKVLPNINYDDLTPEQREEVKFKFEDLTAQEKDEISFHYEDFTPAQLDALVMRYSNLTEAEKNDLASRMNVNGLVEEGNTNAVSGGEVYKTKISLMSGNLVLNTNRKTEVNNLISEIYLTGLQSNLEVFLRSVEIDTTLNRFRVFLRQNGVNITTNDWINYQSTDINKPIKLAFTDGRTNGYVVFKIFSTTNYTAIDASLDQKKLIDITYSPIVLESLLPKSSNTNTYSFTENTLVNLRIKELYLLGDFSTYNLRRLYVQSNSVRLFIASDGSQTASNVTLLGIDNSDDEIYGKVITLYHSTELKIVGYVVLDRYEGVNYTIDSTIKFKSECANLDNSPRIKELLSRSEQLLLMSSSTFGFTSNQNVLKEFLEYGSKFKVYNCGFGGCRMSWRTPTGTNEYDKFSGVDVVDALISKDFTPQITANTALANEFKNRLIDLMNIDLTKPTTIYCKYIDNDITGGAVMGDLWTYNSELNGYDKTTFLGAMNYVVRKLTVAYPHIKWVFFSESWRLKTDRHGVKVPPYMFENSVGNVGLVYSEKEKQNCERLGLPYYDFIENGIQNNYNNSAYFVDDTHFNYKGWKVFSNKLKNLYNSFK